MRQSARRAAARLAELPPWAWLTAITAMLAVLSFGNMTRWSIWFDEAFSAYIVRFNLSEIAYFSGLDVHPPLYYWLLRGWVEIFGTSELGVRSMSLFWAIVALIGLYFLLKRLYTSSNWALIATGLVAVSPMLVRYSHEARMYTLVLAIVVWASYVLLRAQASHHRNWWIGYALLLTLGMLTHYYVALAWLAHWVWRLLETRAGRIPKFWTKEWLYAHLLAVGLFAWWLPTALWQLTTIHAGFWIPRVGAYTPIDFISNTFMYLQYGEVTGWWAVVFFGLCMAGGWLLWRALPLLRRQNISSTNFIVAMLLVPPLILFIISLPPLASTFMDRYVMFSQIALISLLGLALSVVWEANKQARRSIYASLVVILITLAVGLGNVYYYGNYNKNSSTSIRVKELVHEIKQHGEFGQPIIAATPWVYYEAAFYDSRDHRVYFSDEHVSYQWGSTKMLEERDTGKIKDLGEFTQRHRFVWLIDHHTGELVEPLDASWERIKSVEGHDSIDTTVKYRASLFDTQPRS